MRLRRRLERGARPADAPHDEPGAARHPDRARARVGPARAEHPGQDPRHRWRVRRQGAGLSGLRPRSRGEPDRRQAGQVDRGPLGEPPGRLVRPRLPHPRRAGRHQGRQDHLAQGEDDRRSRLHGRRGRPVQVPGRPVQRDHRLVRLPERLRRSRRRLYQQAARWRRLSLLVPGHRSGPRGRADGRHPGPPDRQGPGPAPDGELHPARAVPVQDTDRLVVRLGELPGGAPEGDGHDRLRRPAGGAGREARTWRADGHRHQLVHRDRRRRPLARLRHPRHQDVRFVRDPGPPDGQGHRPARRPEPGPGPRDHVRPDHRRGARLPGRGHQDRGGRHRYGAVRPRHVRVALDAGRRRGDGDGRPQDPGQGPQDRGAPARGERGRPGLGARQVQRQGLARPVQDDPGDRLRGLHQPPGGDGGRTRGGRLLRPAQPDLPVRELHLRRRHRQGDRRGSTSAASWRSTTAATSSTR